MLIISVNCIILPIRMTFIKIYYLLHDLPYYAMIYYFLRYDLLWQPILQPTSPPPFPLALSL